MTTSALECKAMLVALFAGENLPDIGGVDQLSEFDKHFLLCSCCATIILDQIARFAPNRAEAARGFDALVEDMRERLAVRFQNGGRQQ